MSKKQEEDVGGDVVTADAGKKKGGLFGRQRKVIKKDEVSDDDIKRIQKDIEEGATRKEEKPQDKMNVKEYILARLAELSEIVEKYIEIEGQQEDRHKKLLDQGIITQEEYDKLTDG